MPTNTNNIQDNYDKVVYPSQYLSSIQSQLQAPHILPPQILDLIEDPSNVHQSFVQYHLISTYKSMVDRIHKERGFRRPIIGGGVWRNQDKKSYIPLRIKIFIWRAMVCELPLGVALRRRSIASRMFSFCPILEETWLTSIYHLSNGRAMLS